MVAIVPSHDPAGSNHLERIGGIARDNLVGVTAIHKHEVDAAPIGCELYV